jgi:hypothetical protein
MTKIGIAIIYFSVILSMTINGQTVVKKIEKPLSETEKIELLINSVEQLPGAKFYRNGSWYEAKAAADHLQMKLSKAGNRIKTAQDFIDKIATESSMTGEAYKIRYTNGKEVTTKEYFTKKLKEIEAN